MKKRPTDSSPAPGPPEPLDLPDDAGFGTVCAHHGEDRHGSLGAAAPPIYQTSTFVLPDADAFDHRTEPGSKYYDYTRVGNPTTTVLEKKLARLEHGAWCRCFGSGMGAITAAINACIHAGAHVVAIAQCYSPTRRYLHGYLRRFNVETTFVDSCAAGDFAAAMRPETRLLLLESPTTGHFQVPAIRPIADVARERGVVTLFDNSWASPYFQQPLDSGCDLVVHSATKFIGGHSDVVAGALVGRDDELRKKVELERELLGAVLDPFAAWLLVRGLRTLPVRMEHHNRSALEIARMLEAHPKVARVHHPGLASHPHHKTAAKQLTGYGSLFSFELREPGQEAVHRVLNRLRYFSIGVSWGGHESLAVGGSLFSTDPTNPVWLIRLHVGLESTVDLIADLRQALA